MKKKRFYNDKKRGKKWTEPEQGRKIYFADKYNTDNVSDNKFNQTPKKERKKHITKEQTVLFFKRIGIVLCCLAIVAAGYTIMDLHMERRSMPEQSDSEKQSGGISDVSLNISSRYIESLTLDGAVMLDAVIGEVVENGFSSVTFDIKRDDGTIGFRSALATIDAAGAVSSPAADLKTSAKTLKDNDIMLVGRVVCYKDNLMPLSDSTLALKADGNIAYKDSQGSLYLDPGNNNTYIYIRSIIEEASGSGISVFALDGCDIPGTAAQTNSGYDELVQKLQRDIGSSVKFLQYKSIDIKSAQENDINEQAATMSASSDVIYNVNCTEENMAAVRTALDNKGITAYIINP